MTETTKWIPMDVDDLTLAFPASVRKMMPPYEEIPREFRHSSNKWNKLFSDWFFAGIKDLELVPKDGVDLNKALRHIKAIMGSFEPKHEHKEAAVAFLFNEWFSDVKYKVRPLKR